MSAASAGWKRLRGPETEIRIWKAGGPMCQQFHGLGRGRLEQGSFVESAERWIKTGPVLDVSVAKLVYSVHGIPAGLQCAWDPSLGTAVPAWESEGHSQC